MTVPPRFDGLLLIDKPSGWTSHDVVMVIRKRLPRGAKVGHCGTLDPAATGLLILLIGSATKSADAYQKRSKVYTGSIRLGVRTETGDLDAKQIENFEVPELDPESIAAAMSGHLGEREMTPPMYSAVKYQGKPLYYYARNGLQAPAKPRTVNIYEWDLLDWSKPEVKFRLFCSHGTYARSLAVSLGERLGTHAALSSLRRERIGEFDISGAAALDAARAMPMDQLQSRLIPPARPEAALPAA